MTTPELLNYIRAAMAQSQSFELTKTLLLQNGWGEADIEEARSVLGISVPPSQSAASQELRTNAEDQITRAQPHPADTTLVSSRPAQSQPDPAALKKPFYASSRGPSPAPGQSNKKRELLAITISIIVILVVLGGGGTFAYVSFIKESPEDLVYKTIPALILVNSLRYDLQLQTEIALEKGAIPAETAPPFDTGTANLDVRGIIDFGEGKLFKGTYEANARLGGGGVEFLLAAEARRIGDTAYFRVAHIPFLDDFIDASLYKNRWIKITKSDIENLTGETIPVSEDNFHKKLSLLSENEKRGAVVEVKKDIAESGVIGVTAAYPDETVNGVATRRLGLSLNGKKFVEDVLKRIAENESLTSEEKKEVEAAIKLIDTIIIDHGTISSLEVWIGKKDKLPYKVKLSGNLELLEPPAETTEETIHELYTKGTLIATVTFSLSLSLSEFNVPQEVVEPESWASVEQITEEISGSIPFGNGGMNSPVTDGLYSIQQFAEVYYATNNHYGPPVGNGKAVPCPTTGSSMFARDKDIKDHIQMVKDANGGTPPLCATGLEAKEVQSYAVSSVLPGSDKSACVDSAGYVGEGSAAVLNNSTASCF